MGQKLKSSQSLLSAATVERDGLRASVLQLREEVAKALTMAADCGKLADVRLATVQRSFKEEFVKVCSLSVGSKFTPVRGSRFDPSQLNAILTEEVASHCAVGNLSRLIKEAKLTELKKEVDTLREELKVSSDTVNVLILSLTAAEEFMLGTAPELARKSKLSREQQVEALRAKVKDSRAATDSYRFTSADNVARLNVRRLCGVCTLPVA